MKVTPKRLLRLLDERDGHVCAWTGVDTGRLVPQHRQGGMGGRGSKQRPSNVVWLDSLINGLIESDPRFQEEAVRRGIKVSLHADPSVVPVEHAVHGRCLLDDDGGFVRVDSEGFARSGAVSWPDGFGVKEGFTR